MTGLLSHVLIAVVLQLPPLPPLPPPIPVPPVPPPPCIPLPVPPPCPPPPVPSPGPTDDPPTIGGLTIESFRPRSVVLTWAKVTDDEGIWGYRLYRDGRYLSSRSADIHAVRLYFPCGRHVFRVEVVDIANQADSQKVTLTRRCR